MSSKASEINLKLIFRKTAFQEINSVCLLSPETYNLQKKVLEKKLESHLAVCHSTLRRKQTLILWKKQKVIYFMSFYFWVDAFILRVYFVESALFHICVFDWGKQKMLQWAFLVNSGLQWTLHFAHPQGHWGWIIFNVFLKIVYLHKNCHLIYCVVCEKRKDPLTIYQRHFYS